MVWEVEARLTFFWLLVVVEVTLLFLAFATPQPPRYSQCFQEWNVSLSGARLVTECCFGSTVNINYSNCTTY